MQPSGNPFLDSYVQSKNFGLSPKDIVNRRLDTSNKTTSKPKGAGLLSVLPTALAAGASFIPGVGTVVAGGLGAVGEAARQNLAGEDIDLGKIAGEGAISAIPFGLGRAAKLAKTGIEASKAINVTRKGLQTASKVAPEVEAATTAARSTGTPSGLLDKFSQSQARAVVNPKVIAGTNAAQREGEITRTVQNLVPGMTARQKYENLNPAMGDLSGQIASKLEGHKGIIKSADVTGSINKALEKNVNFDEAVPGFTSARDKFTQQILNQAGRTGNNGLTMAPKDLYEAKKNLGDQLSNAFTKLQKGTPLSPAEEVGITTWHALDEALTKAAPEVKQLTTAQSHLIQAAPGLKQASEKTLGIPLLGVKSRAAEGAVQGGRTLLANLTGGAARSALPAAPGGLRAGFQNAGKYLGALTGQGAARAGVSAVTGQPLADTPATADPTPETLQAEPSTTPLASDESASTSAFTPETLQAMAVHDIHATGGKNLDKIATLEKLFVPTAQTKKPINSTAAGNISDSRSALRGLDELSGSIGNGRASVGPISGRVRSLNPYDTSQQTLQSEIDKTRQIVGKALEGGVLRKEDEEKYKKILPTTADTKEVALNKIENIRRQLQAKLEDYTNLVGSGTNIEDVLGQEAIQ